MTVFCTVAMALTLQPAFNYQPDLCGDGVLYNPRGATISVDPGATEPYFWEVVNAGRKTDTIALKGTAFAASRGGTRLAPQAAKVVNGISIQWFKGTNDVTEKVLAGKLKFRKMPSGAARPNPPLRAEVTADSDATIDDNVVVVLIARSQHKPTHQDIWSVNVRVNDAEE